MVLFLASVAGCSASTPAAKEPDKPPADGGSYESPVDIVETLDQAGIECAGLSEMPGAEDPAMTQNCTGGGDNVIVRVIHDRSELDAEVQAFDGAGLFKGESMVVGKNWNLVGVTAFVEDAHKKLGGDLVKGG